MDYIPFATHNYDAIMISTECGCCYCLQRYNPKEVVEWCDKQHSSPTAICPRCGIDAVVPDSLIAYTDAHLRLWHMQGWGTHSLLKAHSHSRALMNTRP